MGDPISSEPLRKHTPLQHQSRIARIPSKMDLLCDGESIAALTIPFYRLLHISVSTSIGSPRFASVFLPATYRGGSAARSVFACPFASACYTKYWRQGTQWSLLGHNGSMPLVVTTVYFDLAEVHGKPSQQNCAFFRFPDATMFTLYSF